MSTTAPSRPPHTPRRLRPEAPLALQLTAVLGVGVAVAVVVGASALTTVAAVALCLVCGAQARGTAVRPGAPHPGRMVPALAVPLAVVGTFVAYSGGRTGTVRDAAAIVVGCTCVDLVGTLMLRRLRRPIRVLVVADGSTLTGATRRWAEQDAVDLVGVLLLDEDLTFTWTGVGVRTVAAIEEVVEWVRHWDAELVVVVPGGGVDAEAVRRLGWLLERTPAALAVSGVLDSVAPHRVGFARIADATVIHLRPSRPSAMARALKWGFDRVVGLALLVVGLPLIVALWVWIKLESRGPGFFAQTRVGQHGRTFTMFKLRTMRWDSEDLRESLAGLDEGHGPLFKLRRDPRVTRSGRFLRRTSLDELPQLLNVVLGQMSLVGPRPALPEEVSTYDDHVLRRLAVRPGMTGLWQVSGRSDLTWEKSVELDLHYADNYRLRDDLVIGLRTVEAVVRPRGAY